MMHVLLLTLMADVMCSRGLWSSAEQRPCGVWSCSYHCCWSLKVIHFSTSSMSDCGQSRHILAFLHFCVYISLILLSYLRCQLPVECLGTSGHLGHDKLLCGHPVHLHVSVWHQAVPWHSRYLVLWPAVSPALSSCCLQNTYRHRARELQGPHQAVGWSAPEELHSAHQQHRHRTLREILLSCWPWWSQHVYIPRLRWAQSSGYVKYITH